MYERATKASKGPRLVGTLRALETRIKARLYGDRCDGGFILLESIVSIFLITVLMTAMTSFLTTTTQTTNHLRIRQEMIQLADTGIEWVHGFDPKQLGTKRGQATALSTFTADKAKAPLAAALGHINGASLDIDANEAGTGAYNGVCDGNPSSNTTHANVPTTAVCTQLGARQFWTTYYLAYCSAATAGSSCTQAVVPDSFVYVGVSVTTVNPTSANPCTTSSCMYFTSTVINTNANPIVPTSVSSSQNMQPNNQVSYVDDTFDKAMLFNPSGGVAPFRYTATQLPSGLSMNAITGSVSGTITGGAQTYLPTMTVVDGLNNSTSYPFTWKVYALPTVALGSQNSPVNVQLNVAPTYTCSNGPCSFTASGLPTNLRIDPSTGAITGAPSAVGVYYPVITITDAGVKNPDGITYAIAPKTANTIPVNSKNPTSPIIPISWTIWAGPTLATSDQANYVGTALILAAPAVTGYQTPNGWAATGSPSLPPGVSFNTSNGTSGGSFSGTPTTAGTYAVTVSVWDGFLQRANSTFNWTIYGLPTISVPNQNSPLNAAVNVTATTTCSNGPCTYTASGLPIGLSINPTTGALTGTPAAVGVYHPIITITDQGIKNTDGTYATAPQTATTKPTWTVWAGPTLATTDQVNYLGTALTLSAPTVTGYLTPNGWAATGLPPGVSLNTSTGVFSGTPITAGTYTVTISVWDGFLQRANSTFHWTIYALPTITMPNQNTTINAAVNVTPTYTCSNGPCTFAALDLPAGLSIDPNTGAITGRATAAAVNTVTVTITDQGVKNSNGTYLIAPKTASTTFTWSVLTAATVCVPQIALANGSFEAPGPPNVNPGAPNWLVGGSTPLLWDTTEPDNTIEIWKNDNPSATQKAPISAQSANGGLAISAEDGTQWAELNANQTGALYQDINTVPGQILQWSVWHRGRYSGAANASKKDVMQVQIGTTTTQTAQVPTGQNTPNIADGPTAWVLYRGIYTVPAGQKTTRFQFAAVSTASGDNSIGNFIDNLSLNNYVACLANLPGNQLNTVKTAIPALQLSAVRGSGSYSWGGGNTLPAGLSMNNAGLITGAPTAIGSTNVQLTLTDTVTNFQQSVAFTWTVVPPPTVTAPASQSTRAGTAVNLQLATSCLNVTCSYTMIGGPAGLTVTNTGLITGTVTGSSNSFNPTVTVRDSQGVQTTSSPFTWTVIGALAVVSPGNQSSLRASAVSLDMSADTSGGTAPYTYSASNLPGWLTIDSSTGRITGTAPAGASSVTGGITVTVTDSINATATSAGFSWTVYAAPSVTAPANLASSVGTTMSQPLTSSCPNAPCSFAFSGAPGGVSITNGGVITGTISAGTAAVYTGVTVVITDASGNSSSSSSFSWTVNPAPVLANPGNQRASLGAAVNLDLSALAGGGTGTYTYSASGLPSWLSINTNSGLISGTAPGSASNALAITATVTDTTGASATTAPFSYTVTNALNSSISSQTTYKSSAVSLNLNTLTTGGTAPYTYVVTGLPSWLTYNGTTGIISGTAPTVSATTQTTGITVKVTDNVAATVTVGSLAWYLTNLRWTNPTTATTAHGTYVNTNIASYVSGGTGTVSYSATNLPTGVIITAAGILTGTASTPGVWNTVLTATDSVGATVTSAYTWTVS